MSNYAIQRISDMERAIEKLKISAALVSPSSYTIDWIRDQLEADPTFYAWIVSSLQADVTFYNWFRDALEADPTFYTWIVTTLKADPTFYTWIVTTLEADPTFYAWIVTTLEADTAFYTWFRTALNADATFISNLITSFQGNTGFTNWVKSTATYSKESFLTLTRTATQTFTGAVNTNFTWQSVIRNSNSSAQFQTPFVTSGLPSANITIPQAGYYTITFSGVVDVTSTKRFFLSVNGNTLVINTNDNQASSTRMYSSLTNYFATGDVLSFSMTPSVTAVVAVNAENGTNQSPILHIVKVNAAG